MVYICMYVIFKYCLREEEEDQTAQPLTDQTPRQTCDQFEPLTN